MDSLPLKEKQGKNALPAYIYGTVLQGKLKSLKTSCQGFKFLTLRRLWRKIIEKYFQSVFFEFFRSYHSYN
jgi:hypothetical protein